MVRDHRGTVSFSCDRCVVTWTHQGYCQPDGVGEDADGAKAFLKAEGRAACALRREGGEVSRHGEAIYLMVSRFATQLANEHVDTFELHLPRRSVMELVSYLHERTYGYVTGVGPDVEHWWVVLAGPLGEIRIKALAGK